MDFTGNPWIIDAADVTALAAIVGNGNAPGNVISVGGVFYLVVWKGPAAILQVELVGYTSDTDTADVTRYNTKDFAHLNGASDFSTVRTGVTGWTDDGLLIPNNGITHGELKIYHR
jgi:hypothetical protein